jgi:hypothetical protein
VARVPQDSSEWSLVRAISVYDGKEGKEDVEHRNDSGGHEDNIRDFIVECEEEFDEAGEEKEDCRV